jgi:hypothetical protein
VNGSRRGLACRSNLHRETSPSVRTPSLADPETLLLDTGDVALIELTIRNVPDRFRELLVLRELEDLSYRELADVMEVPGGTSMAGLCVRGRPSGLPEHRVDAVWHFNETTSPSPGDRGIVRLMYFDHRWQEHNE